MYRRKPFRRPLINCACLRRILYSDLPVWLSVRLCDPTSAVVTFSFPVQSPTDAAESRTHRRNRRRRTLGQ
jgi:hypothetical protein